MKSLYTLIVGAVFSISAVGPLHADSVMKDVRFQKLTYSENTIYELTGAPNYISTVRFEHGEKAKRVFVGDTDKWDVSFLGESEGNYSGITFKPKSSGVESNVVVETNKRSYTFALISPKNPGQKSMHYSFEK